MLQDDATLERSKPAKKKRLGPRGLALIVACALFMEQLDSTILATALPTMSRSLHVSPISLNVAMTSYLLSLAIFIPASGQVADRYGSRHIFRAAIVLFTIGSILCGFATSLPMLVGTRLLQGLGGAMMVPVGRLLLFRSVPKSELIGANSWLLVPALLGPVIGPPIGGLIVTYVSWRWIFWVNIPVGVLGFALVTLFVEDVRESDPRPFDVKGLVLSGSALSLMLFGLESAVDRIGSETLALGALISSFFLGALYIRHARQHTHPVLELRLLKKQTFRTSIFGGILFRIGVGAMPFLLPLLFQLGFGLSPARSGAITFISAASSMMTKSLTVRALRRWGYRNVMIWNGMLCALSVGACGLFRPSWPIVAIYAILFIGGTFRSLQFNAFGSIAYAEIDTPEMSQATTFTATSQQVSITLGIATSAAVLSASMFLAHHAQPQFSDFTVAFFVVAVLSLMPVPMGLSLSPDAGSELTGRGRRALTKSHR